MMDDLPKFLIVGLGNIGERYARTRHNIGFSAVDVLAERLHVKFIPGKGDYYIASNLPQDRPSIPWIRRLFQRFKKSHTGESAGLGADVPVVIIKPTTLMNRSGLAVGQALARYKLSAARILIITDDFHLPLGAVRLRKSGSDGGHNGLKSLIAELGTDGFPRIRLGIGPRPEKIDIISFVLGEFIETEHTLLQQVMATTASACEFLLSAESSNSLDLAASKYNIVRPDPAPGSSSED